MIRPARVASSVWCPIHKRGVHLHQEMHLEHTLDEIYECLYEEIWDSETALSKKLAGLDKKPRNKESLARGLRDYFSREWWDAKVAAI